jgi:hypothetical protein
VQRTSDQWRCRRSADNRAQRHCASAGRRRSSLSSSQASEYEQAIAEKPGANAFESSVGLGRTDKTKTDALTLDPSLGEHEVKGRASLDLCGRPWEAGSQSTRLRHTARRLASVAFLVVAAELPSHKARRKEIK